MIVVSVSLEVPAIDVLDGEGGLIEIFVVDTVEVDGHGVTALAKRLDATGRAELMINNLFVELVGGHTVLAGHCHLILRDEGKHHALARAVAAVTTNGFSDISLYLQGHRAAVTTPMICFHIAYYIRV